MKRANFGAAGANLSCPICGATIRTDLNAIAASATVRCPRGHVIELKTNRGHELQQSLNSLNRTFDRVNRKFGRK